MSVSEAELEAVRQHMMATAVPTPYQKVYKEECMYSFDTPESEGGLFINLTTFQGFGADYVRLDVEKNGPALYLHEKWVRVPLSEEEKASAAENKPKTMGIGGESGFQVDAKDYTIQVTRTLALLPGDVRVPLPCADLPEVILRSIAGVEAHNSATRDAAVEVAAWEEERRVSKYAADLAQLPADRKISPNAADWKCDETGVTENLWLNLSTGNIGSGRQHWDGSGGNGAALRHFEATGRQYPLVVKLGTITPHGADVFSYAPDEDDLVTDPKLAEHLAHWGINMMSMQATEKTMAELTIDLNMNFELNRICESGAELRPVSGPGLTGLVNLGNSCYMNSVMQVLWTIPELKRRYADTAEAIFRSCSGDPAVDLPVQMAKLGVALVNGRTGRAAPPPPEGDAKPSTEATSVKPQIFKSLIGANHPEFRTNRQQDALEFYQHVLETLTRGERQHASRMAAESAPTAALFSVALQDRIQCRESLAVSYQTNSTNVLGLQIPLEAAINQAEVSAFLEREGKRQRLQDEQAVAYIGADGMADSAAPASVACDDNKEDPVIPRVPFEACLAKLFAEEVMEGYASAALGGKKTTASKSTRIAAFPPYLMLQMRRYYVTPEWVPKKMDVLVDVPDALSLERFRGAGPADGETLQPADAPPQPPPPAAPQPDAEIVSQLMNMGFSENACKRAALATTNSGAEAAINWVMAHMDDADLNDPLPDVMPAPGAAAPAAAVDPEQVMMLTSMGFTDAQAGAALGACGNNLERAADWLFSHADDLDAAVAAVSGGGAPGAEAGPTDAPAAENDGPGEYELVGFISHMGANTACGHYVCHIKKDGAWIIFNDDKVALSEAPPRDLGYMYMFKRKDV